MNRKTVLVVDPNPATPRKVGEAFQGSGFDILHARDTTELERRLNGADAVDLVFSAVSLPAGNGYDLARALRDRHPEALVYLLSGGFEVYDEGRARDAGVDGRVRLPFTPRGLRAMVEDTLGPLPQVSKSPESAPISGVLEAVPVYEGPIETASTDLVPLSEGDLPTAPISAPPGSDERLATFLPRDYRDQEPVVVDPEVVMPALERAVLEVLPEVVEGVLRNALASSPAFRDLVTAAVEEGVREGLHRIARSELSRGVDAEASHQGRDGARRRGEG